MNFLFILDDGTADGLVLVNTTQAKAAALKAKGYTVYRLGAADPELVKGALASIDHLDAKFLAHKERVLV